MFDRKIIDELKESNGYSIALLTTFNFEINYFERCILNTLYNNDIRKVEIFFIQIIIFAFMDSFIKLI